MKNTVVVARMTQHMFIKACIYIYGPSTKVPSKLKYVDENEGSQ